MDPMHEFHKVIQNEIVYQDSEMASKIQRYQGELLLFWNWSITSLSGGGKTARASIQQRLDYEMPSYLQLLREDINKFADPNYRVDFAVDERARKPILGGRPT
jgi:hypothetical protein